MRQFHPQVPKTNTNCKFESYYAILLPVRFETFKVLPDPLFPREDLFYPENLQLPKMTQNMVNTVVKAAKRE